MTQGTTALWKTKTFWLAIAGIAASILNDDALVGLVDPKWITIATLVLAAIFRADAKKEVRIPGMGTPTERARKRAARRR